MQVKDYCDDPLNFHGMVKARVANEMLKGFAVLAANTSEYKLSMLAIHGDADKITSFQASSSTSLSRDKSETCPPVLQMRLLAASNGTCVTWHVEFFSTYW